MKCLKNSIAQHDKHNRGLTEDSVYFESSCKTWRGSVVECLIVTQNAGV